MAHDVVQTPSKLKEKHKKVTLHIDMTCTNGEGFLTSIRMSLQHRKCSHIEDNSGSQFCNAIDEAVRTHNGSGFHVKTIKCDGAFKSLMDEVKDDMDVNVNHANRDDHEQMAERNNGMIEDQRKFQSVFALHTS